MRSEVKYAASVEEFLTDEGCHILEVANDSEDDISIARARIEVGVTTLWHRVKNTAERYLIISGQGMVEVQGINSTVVGPGDVVRIPPDIPQRITNIGSEDLILYCICSPRFDHRNYQQLEM